MGESVSFIKITILEKVSYPHWKTKLVKVRNAFLLKFRRISSEQIVADCKKSFLLPPQVQKYTDFLPGDIGVSGISF